MEAAPSSSSIYYRVPVRLSRMKTGLLSGGTYPKGAHVRKMPKKGAQFQAGGRGGGSLFVPPGSPDHPPLIRPPRNGTRGVYCRICSPELGYRDIRPDVLRPSLQLGTFGSTAQFIETAHTGVKGWG
uniref:Uncharacterized protein n=1 Tax=Odontella aurita TaxID=265563 RepID=A0A7S4I2P8_9STRA